ncbi:MAG TPA: SIS domain-containing protein [Balneolaceae bacterium]|nr:SIS domain-containing protein [Balneolaceae bacterium]
MNSLISNFLNSKNKTSYTNKEILGQPDLWKNTFDKITNREEEIKQFFRNKNIHPDSNVKIVLTGAGSSAYIGEISQFSFKNAGFKNTEAIPTTDLVTHFTQLIDIKKPLLLISFGRSGNSPESEAVINLANKYCEEISHLIISCNKNGKLALNADAKNSCVFILPPAAEDQGLAMTGSFSSMVLAASLIADISSLKKYEPVVGNIAEIGSEILHEHLKLLNEIARKDFKRIIFLGDGPNLGCAREAHLKVQELSDGICIGKFDSFLGFRHGPKAVVNDQSLLVYLLSNNKDVMRYQIDLIEQIAEENLGMHTLALSSIENIDELVDTNLYIPALSEIPEHLLALPYVLAAQIIGFFKSHTLGLDPDNPSQNGAISRVVEGVTIY